MVNTKRIKKLSKQRENKIADDIGGQRHSFSGAMWWKKGDASNDDFLIEDKFTEDDHYSATLRVLLKIEKEALSIGKLPVLRVGFIKDRKSTDYVVLRAMDCLSSKLIPGFSGAAKSFRLKSTHLKELHMSENKIILTFSIRSNLYVVMGWDDFVMCKDIIISGGKI